MRIKAQIFFVFLISFVLCSSALAASKSRKIAPVADPSRQTLFNKTTDFIATAGESPSNKQQILRERRKNRREARVSAQNRKQRAKTQKRLKKEQQVIMKKL